MESFYKLLQIGAFIISSSLMISATFIFLRVVSVRPRDVAKKMQREDKEAEDVSLRIKELVISSYKSRIVIGYLVAGFSFSVFAKQPYSFQQLVSGHGFGYVATAFFFLVVVLVCCGTKYAENKTEDLEFIDKIKEEYENLISTDKQEGSCE